MKKLISIISIFLIVFTLNAAPKKPEVYNAEMTYRKALNSFDIQDYGKALKYSEDAILYRKQNVSKELELLENAISPKQVQNAGDEIEMVLKVLDKRGEKEAIKIINKYIKIKSIEYFDSSIKNLLAYIKGTEVYPEAQKLIGDIYKLEGEYGFAEDYYKMALANKDYLDISDEQYEILYMLADISRLQNDDEQMEVRLLNILTEDNSFKDVTLQRAILRTLKQNKKESVEKLFTLYRANSYHSLKAYNELTEYYYKKGEKDKSLTFAALFAITSFSKIYETIQIRNFDYEYENLGTFFQEASFYNDIVKWGSENYVWKSFNILARYSNEYGYSVFAKELLRVLVQYSPERYWQQEAVLELQKIDPQLE